MVGVTTTFEKMAFIPLSYSGHRQSVVICNATPNDIVFITRDGTKTVVKPSKIYKDGTVKIFRQEFNGECADHVSKQDGVMEFETKSTLVQRSAFEAHGLYVAVEDIFICTKAVSEWAQHPKVTMTYTEAISHSIAKSIEDGSRVIGLANDPLNRADRLFFCIMGYCIEVACTKHPSVNATFTCRILDGDSDYVAIDENMDDVFAKGHMAFEIDKSVVTIGITREEAKSGYLQATKDRLIMSREDLNKKLVQLKEEVAEEHAETIAELESDVQTHLTKIEALKLELLEKDNKIITIDMRLSRYVAEETARAEQRKARLVEETLEYKRDEQVHKNHREAISTGGDAVKVFGNVAKVVVGIVVGAIAAAYMAPAASAGATLFRIFAFWL
jgi:hypothetical protein